MQFEATSTPIQRLLNTEHAAAFLGLSPKTLEGWRVRGDGPRFHKLGRAVRYSHDDLTAFLAERQRMATT